MRIVHALEVRSSFVSGPFISEIVILSKETYYASQTYKLIKVRIHCVRAEAVSSLFIVSVDIFLSNVIMFCL